jgi:hypothetical protein
MLVGMAVGTMRTVCQRLEGAVVPFAPAVNILPVQMVADGRLCDAVLVGILNHGLPEAHGLCYLIHGEWGDTCLSVLSQQLNLITGHPYSLSFFSICPTSL